jgi:hypothetical protein
MIADVWWKYLGFDVEVVVGLLSEVERRGEKLKLEEGGMAVWRGRSRMQSDIFF